MMSDELFWFWGIYIFVCGLCIGSFLNVAALRAIWGESIVFPASKCHSCGNKLKWYHNIPVLSWIFLRGKCGFCKAPISIQYPIVELSNAVLYFGIYYTYGLTWKSLFLAILISFFIVMTITDIKEQVVFNQHVYPPIVLGILYNIFGLGDISIWESLLGILAGFLVFEGLARLGYLFTKSRAFGEGDTIIAMGIGAFFGWKAFLLCAILSVLSYALIIFPIFIKKSIQNKNKNPLFGLLGAALCIILLYVHNFFIASFAVPFEIIFWIFFIAGIFVSIKYILSDLINKTEDELYKSEHSVPYGPGLVLGTIIFIFFGKQIIEFIGDYFGLIF